MKGLLRLMAWTGVGQSDGENSGNDWEVERFVMPTLTTVTGSVLLVGPPGPGRKTTVLLKGADGASIAFMKWASREIGMGRIRREASILDRLPEGFGPDVLKLGRVCGGQALLLSVVDGDPAPSLFPPPAPLVKLVSALPSFGSVSLSDHPAIKRLDSGPTEVVHAVETLLSSGAEWDICIQHGDLAPWNVLVDKMGSQRLIDWEYAREDGLRGRDLVHYMLQVAFFAKRWSIDKTVHEVTEWLLKEDVIPVYTPDEARAFLTITAYEDLNDALGDGYSSTQPVLVWKSQLVGGAR